MFDQALLDILCCPETRGKLSMVDEGTLSSLNRDISAGTVKNVAGEKVVETMTEALISADGKRLYPIREGIPVLLADEAIMLSLEEK